MAITSAFVQVAKVGYGRGRNAFANTYNMALYKETASLNSATTRYLTGGEISGTGYSAGGKALTGYAVTLDSGNAIFDWADVQWTNSTFSTGGALLYNDSSVSKEAIGVFAFTSAKEVSSGTFTIQFPTPASGTAVIELG